MTLHSSFCFTNGCTVRNAAVNRSAFVLACFALGENNLSGNSTSVTCVATTEALGLGFVYEPLPSVRTRSYSWYAFQTWRDSGYSLRFRRIVGGFVDGRMNRLTPCSLLLFRLSSFTSLKIQFDFIRCSRRFRGGGPASSCGIISARIGDAEGAGATAAATTTTTGC